MEYKDKTIYKTQLFRTLPLPPLGTKDLTVIEADNGKR